MIFAQHYLDPLYLAQLVPFTENVSAFFYAVIYTHTPLYDIYAQSKPLDSPWHWKEIPDGVPDLSKIVITK